MTTNSSHDAHDTKAHPLTHAVTRFVHAAYTSKNATEEITYEVWRHRPTDRDSLETFNHLTRRHTDATTNQQAAHTHAAAITSALTTISPADAKRAVAAYVDEWSTLLTRRHQEATAHYEAHVPATCHHTCDHHMPYGLTEADYADDYPYDYDDYYDHEDTTPVVRTEPTEPPRHVRRLRSLGRMESCQGVRRRGTRSSCVSGRSGWSARSGPITTRSGRR